MSSDAVEGYLARNVARIRRTPELQDEIAEVRAIDGMIAEMALARLDALGDFTPQELAFFERGEEEERLYMMSVSEEE